MKKGLKKELERAMRLQMEDATSIKLSELKVLAGMDTDGDETALDIDFSEYKEDKDEDARDLESLKGIDFNDFIIIR